MITVCVPKATRYVAHDTKTVIMAQVAPHSYMSFGMVTHEGVSSTLNR